MTDKPSHPITRAIEHTAQVVHGHDRALRRIEVALQVTQGVLIVGPASVGKRFTAHTLAAQLASTPGDQLVSTDPTALAEHCAQAPLGALRVCVSDLTGLGPTVTRKVLSAVQAPAPDNLVILHCDEPSPLMMRYPTVWFTGLSPEAMHRILKDRMVTAPRHIAQGVAETFGHVHYPRTVAQAEELLTAWWTGDAPKALQIIHIAATPTKHESHSEVTKRLDLLARTLGHSVLVAITNPDNPHVLHGHDAHTLGKVHDMLTDTAQPPALRLRLATATLTER